MSIEPYIYIYFINVGRQIHRATWQRVAKVNKFVLGTSRWREASVGAIPPSQGEGRAGIHQQTTSPEGRGRGREGTDSTIVPGGSGERQPE